MTNKNIIITIIITIVISLGTFYGGILYQNKKIEKQKSQKGNFQGKNDSQQRGQRFGGLNNPDGSFENGEIISKDDKSITIKTRNGGSKIIYFSDSTQIGKSVDGSTADLEVGRQVMVNGKSDQTGAITAQNIQIRPDQPKNQ